MTSRLAAVCFSANDPLQLARFWAAVLGRDLIDEREEGAALPPNDEVSFRIRFRPTTAAKAGQNQMHFDLTSTSPAHQQQTVADALRLGAGHIDVGQRPEEGHVVLADPEGNEFCVIEAGNEFLAGCGLVGAVACDGSREVGLFWSEALGWPLVWDRNQETAIRSPRGGPKLTWGGPPLMPKSGTSRIQFELSPQADLNRHTEVDRLVSLGATRSAPGQGASWVTLTDPDGNEFRMLELHDPLARHRPS